VIDDGVEMATTMSDSPGSGVDPDRCDNAGQFVRRRLSAADEPLSPAELADTYGCRKGYMRSVVADLAGEGVIDRVGRGRYVIEEGDGSERPSDENGFSLTLSEENEADSPDEDTDESEENQMPTDSEYRQQHAGSEGESQDGESTENESDSVGTEGSDGVDSGDVAAVASGVDPRTLMLLVAVAAVGYVAYRSLSGSDSGSDQAADGAEDQDEPVEDAVEVAGGLVG
jgi:hypothetical protein